MGFASELMIAGFGFGERLKLNCEIGSGQNLGNMAGWKYCDVKGEGQETFICLLLRCSEYKEKLAEIMNKRNGLRMKRRDNEKRSNW